MSTAVQPQAGVQTETQAEELFKAAAETLRNDVYLPYFFDRLASRGVVPANDEEAVDYIKLAGYVQARRVMQAQQQQQATQSLAKRAVARLQQEVEGGPKTNVSPDRQAYERGLYEFSKTAAAQLSQMPQLQQALAVYQAAHAG